MPPNTAADDERVVHAKYQAYRDGQKYFSRNEVK